MLSQRKTKLIAIYVRLHLLVPFLVGLPSLFFQYKAGTFAPIFFWFKLITSLGFAALLYFHRRLKMVFYQNFGLSTRFLVTVLFAIDFTTWALLSYAVHFGSR